MAKARGSVWANKSKKKSYKQSIGSYGYVEKGDRFFKLTPVSGGKGRVFESPQEAMTQGWYIVVHGK